MIGCIECVKQMSSTSLKLNEVKEKRRLASIFFLGKGMSLIKN